MALRALCQRSYWRRVWIVQEVTLAADISIFCGKTNCRLEDFSPFFNKLADENITAKLKKIPFGEEIASSTASVVVVIKAKGLGVSEGFYFWFVEKCRDCFCTDDRDHVFGLLGPVRKTELKTLGIYADYTKTPMELYRHILTNCFIQNDWDKDALRRHGSLLREALRLQPRLTNPFLQLGPQLLPQSKLRWKLRIRAIRELTNGCHVWASLANPPASLFGQPRLSRFVPARCWQSSVPTNIRLAA